MDCMCRRGLTHLLLPAILLAQFVGTYRCTGGCGAAGQDGRPHVHLHAATPGLTGTKRCGCQRQREVAAPQDCRTGTPLLACSISLAPSEPAHGHDTDDLVLYLSFDATNGGLTSSGGEVRAGGERDQQPVVLGARHVWPGHQCDSLAQGLSTSPPPRARCPVYLCVRSLLI